MFFNQLIWMHLPKFTLLIKRNYICLLYFEVMAICYSGNTAFLLDLMYVFGSVALWKPCFWSWSDNNLGVIWTDSSLLANMTFFSVQKCNFVFSIECDNIVCTCHCHLNFLPCSPQLYFIVWKYTGERNERMT